MNKRLQHVSLEQIMLFFFKCGVNTLTYTSRYRMYVCMRSINPPVWKTTRARVCVCVCLHEGKTLEELRVRPLHGVLRTLGEAILQQY